MPTATKLVAAVWFGVIAWLAANAYVPSLGEGVAVGRFREFCALIGVVCGWRVMGREAGYGMAEAIFSGLKTTIIMVFFALLAFSIYVMMTTALKGRHANLMEAVLSVFDLMRYYATSMLMVGVMMVLGGGAILGGVICENVKRRWR